MYTKRFAKVKYCIYFEILLIRVFSWFSELMHCLGSILVIWLEWFNFWGCLKISWLSWISVGLVISWLSCFNNWVICCSDQFQFWNFVLGLNDGSGSNLKISWNMAYTLWCFVLGGYSVKIYEMWSTKVLRVGAFSKIFEASFQWYLVNHIKW